MDTLVWTDIHCLDSMTHDIPMGVTKIRKTVHSPFACLRCCCQLLDEDEAGTKKGTASKQSHAGVPPSGASSDVSGPQRPMSVIAWTASMRLATASKDVRLAIRAANRLLTWVDARQGEARSLAHGKGPSQRTGGRLHGAPACPMAVVCCLHQLIRQVRLTDETLCGWSVVE